MAEICFVKLWNQSWKDLTMLNEYLLISSFLLCFHFRYFYMHQYIHKWDIFILLSFSVLPVYERAIMWYSVSTAMWVPQLTTGPVLYERSGNVFDTLAAKEVSDQGWGVLLTKTPYKSLHSLISPLRKFLILQKYLLGTLNHFYIWQLSWWHLSNMNVIFNM